METELCMGKSILCVVVVCCGCYRSEFVESRDEKDTATTVYVQPDLPSSIDISETDISETDKETDTAFSGPETDVHIEDTGTIEDVETSLETDSGISLFDTASRATSQDDSETASFGETDSETISDPCASVTCDDGRICATGSDGSGYCRCPDGWAGPGCDMVFQVTPIPPAVQDMAIDNAGIWFATGKGALYWMDGSTPDDTSDDEWRLFAYEQSGAALKTTQIELDADGRPWVLHSNETVAHLNDLSSNDAYFEPVHLGIPAEPYTQTQYRRIAIDPTQRLWVVKDGDLGVYTLAIADLSDQASEPSWNRLFESESVRDMAFEGDGVWLAADSGLYYVLLGEIETTVDDILIDFVPSDGMGDIDVERIFIDSAGIKWFSSGNRLARLDDRGDPSDKTFHVWTEQLVNDDGAGRASGALIGVEKGGVKWFRTAYGTAERLDDTTAAFPLWTTYDPKRCPLYNDPAYTERFDSGVSAFSVDAYGKKWISSDNDIYYWDDGGTRTETADDLWVRVGRRDRGVDAIRTMRPDPKGGIWMVEEWYGQTSYSSWYEIYYFNIGDPRFKEDDLWLAYPLPFSLRAFKNLCAVDDKGLKWFCDYQYIRSGMLAVDVLDDGGTLLDTSDDTWDELICCEGGIPSSTDYLVFDPKGGVWFSDRYYDPGATMGDPADDRWLAVDEYRADTLAVDAAGDKWFGSRSDAVAPLRYLDDNGTPMDADDDIWVIFTPEDGMPFEGISALKIDSGGDKWILDGNRQLYRFDDNGTPLDKADDVWPDAIFDGDFGAVNSFIIDDADHLWLGLDRGVGYLQAEGK